MELPSTDKQSFLQVVAFFQKHTRLLSWARGAALKTIWLGLRGRRKRDVDSPQIVFQPQASFCMCSLAVTLVRVCSTVADFCFSGLSTAGPLNLNDIEFRCFMFCILSDFRLSSATCRQSTQTAFSLFEDATICCCSVYSFCSCHAKSAACPDHVARSLASGRASWSRAQMGGLTARVFGFAGYV